EDLTHGLVTGSAAREWYSIHPGDPLSAEMRTHWTETLSRGDWAVRTETFAGMTSDAGHFHLTARIEAWEGEEMIFEKKFERKIPRDNM
ncbi:MAG: peptidase S15, partial [Alphaproteobacteria bacterium]|nr:peptidase S15 [Alphaproteobacteria bacterium]